MLKSRGVHVLCCWAALLLQVSLAAPSGTRSHSARHSGGSAGSKTADLKRLNYGEMRF